MNYETAQPERPEVQGKNLTPNQPLTQDAKLQISNLKLPSIFALRLTFH
jgi:hypothetical protein